MREARAGDQVGWEATMVARAAKMQRTTDIIDQVHHGMDESGLVLDTEDKKHLKELLGSPLGQRYFGNFCKYVMKQPNNLLAWSGMIEHLKHTCPDIIIGRVMQSATAPTKRGRIFWSQAVLSVEALALLPPGSVHTRVTPGLHG